MKNKFFAKNNKGFLLVSAFIILSDILFIIINYYSALDTLNKEIEDWAVRAENVFNITLENKSISMQQLAAFVANDPRVVSLFLKGKNAVKREGGGPGGSEASMIRKELFNLVSPGWKRITELHDVRQLHFHLGPGSTSFLRVHRPEKFGDNMDTVRYTIVDANKLLKETRGFETGRVYSGIRGVVPVFMENDSEKIHIGALEAGTSFSALLKSLRENMGCEFAVLLSEQHVTKNMWKDFIDHHFSADLKVNHFFIESTSTPKIKRIVRIEKVAALLKTTGSALINHENPYQICSFPLRDYRGHQAPELPDSGRILVWRDASAKIENFNRNLKRNLIYALTALAFVEILLFFTWKYSRTRLENIVDQRTRELKESLEQVKILSGLLPICSFCKKIRDDKGYWNRIEKYIQDNSEAKFSHGVCRDCAEKYYPDYDIYKDDQD